MLQCPLDCFFPTVYYFSYHQGRKGALNRTRILGLVLGFNLILLTVAHKVGAGRDGVRYCTPHISSREGMHAMMLLLNISPCRMSSDELGVFKTPGVDERTPGPPRSHRTRQYSYEY